MLKQKNQHRRLFSFYQNKQIVRKFLLVLMDIPFQTKVALKYNKTISAFNKSKIFLLYETSKQYQKQPVNS